ncbi:MAG: hypothetical protein Q8903_12200, partial [Bacteroidota bacterium]|nr:hypothetical protein [Bacteroidota bacterium]
MESGSNRLVASGRVTNTGSAHVTSPWYIEAQFYTSKNSSAKLGGGNTQIDVPLNSGQSTLWTIYYSSANVDAKSYPDFDIRDFRGIYK